MNLRIVVRNRFANPQILIDVLTILSPEKEISTNTHFVYNFMDFPDIFKPMDKNPRIKGNPSIWSAAQETY